MPSVSGKQHRFMAAVANNPKFAKKAGVPQSVGEEFIKADKGRKFSEGGDMKESKKMIGKELAFMKAKFLAIGDQHDQITLWLPRRADRAHGFQACRNAR